MTSGRAEATTAARSAPARSVPVRFAPVRTMTPAIRTGRSCFDRWRLPRDEYARRVEEVEALARSEDLVAVVVVANAETPAAVVHLANLGPTAGAATVVVVPGSGAVLMAGRGGQREEPYQRDVTWIPSLLQRPFGADSVRHVLAERGATAGRLGVAGLEDQVPVRVRDRFVAEMDGFELVPVDRRLAELRRRLSVRERSVLGELDQMLRRALGYGGEEFASCGIPARAALAVERELYSRGCRDVRLLVGWPDGSVRPFEAVDDRRGSQFACYVQAELIGYWAEAATTSGTPSGGNGEDARGEERAAAARALESAWSRLRAGADPSAVAGEVGSPGVEVLVRGLGTEIVGLPDPAAGWTDLRAGDAVSVLAVASGIGPAGVKPAAGGAGSRLVMESRAAVVGADGPTPIGDVVIPGL